MRLSVIKVEFSKIKVDSVEASEYKKGIFQAQLRQTVTTTYPSKIVGNSESDSLFDAEDFNIPDGKEYTTDRLTWLDVPEGTTIKQVEAKLKALPKAKLYRKISHNVMDVLTEQQISAIENGITTVEAFENSKVVKDSSGDIVDRGNGPEYRQYFFDATGAKTDVDYRPTSVKEVSSKAAKIKLTA